MRFRMLDAFNPVSPTFWESSIRAFERYDLHHPPPEHPVVFVGSSTIEYWDTLQRDMAPLAVLNRGFGGAQIHQVTHYADRIVLRYCPRAVVFYAGENDIAGVLLLRKKSPEQALSDFKLFCEKLHAVQANLPIFFLSIKPPMRRMRFWPAMQQVNRLIQDYCTRDAHMHYLDITHPMQDGQGRTRSELFSSDGVHLNARGYAVLTSVIRPVLINALSPITVATSPAVP